jgi:hypothetical protein
MGFTSGSVTFGTDKPTFLEGLVQLNGKNKGFLPAVSARNGVGIATLPDFQMSQVWDAGDGSQTGLSENSACAGVAASKIDRVPEYNSIQLFQEMINVTTLRASSTAGVSGLAGGESGGVFETQLAAKLAKISADLDYSMLLGTRASADTNPANPWQMGGIIPAVIAGAGANYFDANGAALDADMIDLLLARMFDAGASLDMPAFVVNPLTKTKLTKLFTALNSFDRGGAELVAGVRTDSISTNFAQLPIILDVHVPAATILIADLEHIRPVVLPAVSDGVLLDDLILEEKESDGACKKWMLYGQMSIDFKTQKLHGVVDSFI